MKISFIFEHGLRQFYSSLHYYRVNNTKKKKKKKKERKIEKKSEIPNECGKVTRANIQLCIRIRISVCVWENVYTCVYVRVRF